MKVRVLTLAVMVSSVFAAGILLHGLAASFIAPCDFRLSLTPSLHIAVSNARTAGRLGRIEVFNDAEYGPYHGSIIGIVGPDGKTHSPLDRKVAWGDSWGVFYRYFRGQDGGILWTLSVSLWYPLLATAALPITQLLRRRKRLLKR